MLFVKIGEVKFVKDINEFVATISIFLYRYGCKWAKKIPAWCH